MTVKATYGGQTYEFDGNPTDEQIYQYFNTKVTPTQSSEQVNSYLMPQTQQPQQPQDEGWGLGEGGISGIGTAAKSGLIAGLGHMAAAFHDDNSVYSSPFEDPNTSRYASQTAAGYKQQAEQAESKLGVAGKLVAGAAEYAPAMAAGIVNPVFGAGVAGAESTGDILGSQYEERGEYNRGMALAGGAVTGAAQLATGGLAGKATSALEGQTGRLATLGRAAIAPTEAAAQGMGFQVGANVGTGHDLTEGLPEAAVTGVVAHGLMSGGGSIARRALPGLSRKLGIPVNEQGQQAITDVKQMENLGNQPSQGLVDASTETKNYYGDISDKAKKGEASTQDFNEMSDLATNHGGDAALVDAYTDAVNAGVPITKAAFDFNYTEDLKGNSEQHHAAEQLGSSPQEAKATLEANMKARPSYGKSGEEAKVAGNTWQTHAANVQELGKKHLQNMLGSFDSNVNYVDKQINRGRMEGWDKNTMQQYSELGKSLRELYKIADNYASQNKRDFADSAEYESSRAMELAHNLGETSNLISTRKGEDFNPAHDIRKIDTTERMFRSEYPSFHAGNPRTTVEKFAPKAKELTVTDLGLGMATKGLYPVARKIVGGVNEHIKAKRAQKALAQGVEETKALAKGFAQRAPERLQGDLEQGNMTGAASESEHDLEASGINVGKGAPEAATVMPETTGYHAENLNELQRGIEEAQAKPHNPENAREVSQRQTEKSIYEGLVDRNAKGHTTNDHVAEAISKVGGIRELYQKHSGDVAKMHSEVQNQLRLDNEARKKLANEKAERDKKAKSLRAQRQMSRIEKEKAKAKYNQDVKDFRDVHSITDHIKPEQIEEAIKKASTGNLFNKSKASQILRALAKGEKVEETTPVAKTTKEVDYADLTNTFERTQRAKRDVTEDEIAEAVDEATENGVFKPKVAEARIKAIRDEKKAAIPKEPSAPKETPANKALRWTRIQHAKGINPELVAKAEKEAWFDNGEDFDTQIANAAMGRISRETKAEEKAAEPVRTRADDRKDLQLWAHKAGVDLNKYPGLMKDIKSKTTEEVGKGGNEAMKPNEMRNFKRYLMNKFDTLIRQAEVNEERATNAKVKKDTRDYLKKLTDDLNNLQEAFTKSLSEEAIRDAHIKEIDKEMDKANKRMEELESSNKSLSKEVEVVKEGIRNGLGDSSTEEIGDILDTIAHHAEEGRYSTIDNIATLEVVAEKSKGEFSKVHKKLAEVLKGVEQRKQEYPDNPKMWLAREDFDEIKGLKYDVEGSHAGSLGVNLINSAFGRHKDVVQNVTNLKNRDQIAAMIEKKASGQEAREEKAKSFKETQQRFKQKAKAKREGVSFVG